MRKAIFYPVMLLCMVFILLGCKPNERAAVILFHAADSIEQAGDLVKAREVYEEILTLYPETQTASYIPSKELINSMFLEADAMLDEIRKQLRVYYGENGAYPTSDGWTMVIGARWHDIDKGELTGEHFKDEDYEYMGLAYGDNFIVRCTSKKVRKIVRSIDETGKHF